MSKYETLIKIIDELRNEAPEDFVRYHPKDNELEKLNHARSRAFIHLFLKGMYGLDKFQERENYITDDPQDGGVDAYYIDASLKEIIFIQSKFRTNETNFETKEISYDELLAMDVDRIIQGEEVDGNQIPYNSKIKIMQKKIQEIEDIARYRYKVIILANLKNTNDSYLRRLTGGLSSTIFDFEKCYNKLVFPIVSGCFFNADEIIIDLSLVNKEGNEGRIGYTVHTAMSDCKILVTYIPLIEIAKILYKYKLPNCQHRQNLKSANIQNFIIPFFRQWLLSVEKIKNILPYKKYQHKKSIINIGFSFIYNIIIMCKTQKYQ